MNPTRTRDLKLDIASIGLVMLLLVIPLTSASPQMNSLAYQISVGVSATMAIYIMLRMGLLSFTVPAFMAFGAYSAAVLAKAGVTNLLALMAISFVVPVLIAIPLGTMVLRLKGIYFIFITFVFNEILQLVIFETPQLTGGSDGISGIPPATFFGLDTTSQSGMVIVAIVTCLLAMICTLIVTQKYRAEFTSIEDNQTLAESLGVVSWKYRTIAFVASSGVAGLAGFTLMNMLSTAHPSSFSSWSVIGYIAYAFIGGRGTMLGIVSGSILLIFMTSMFANFAALSAGLYGLLLVIVLTLAPTGLVGSAVAFVDRWRRPSASHAQKDANP